MDHGAIRAAKLGPRCRFAISGCILRLLPILDGESSNFCIILGENVDMLLSTLHRTRLRLVSLRAKIISINIVSFIIADDQGPREAGNTSNPA